MSKNVLIRPSVSSITAEIGSGGTAPETEIFRSMHPTHMSAGTLNQRFNNTNFYAPVSGTYKFEATMRITSGTYYFAFGIYDETEGSIHWHSYRDGGSGYSSYESPSGQSGNVHNLKQYRFTVPGIKSGHQYKVFMNASNAGGSTEYTNASQTNELEQFKVYVRGDQGISLNKKLTMPYWPTPNVSSDSGTGNKIFETNNSSNILVHPNTYTQTLGTVNWRAYSRYLDIRTSFNNNSGMIMATMSGYFYNHGICWALRGGYTYTSNSVIAQQETHIGGPYIYNFYRDSNGFLCIKCYKSSTGYTEGRALIGFGGFGSGEWDQDGGVRITGVVASNSSSSQF